MWSPFVQYYKRRSYLWVQLAGHEGNFKPGQLAGTILKKLCARESKCLQLTMRDVLRPFVPEFKAEVMQDGEGKWNAAKESIAIDLTPVPSIHTHSCLIQTR